MLAFKDWFLVYKKTIYLLNQTNQSFSVPNFRDFIPSDIKMYNCEGEFELVHKVWQSNLTNVWLWKVIQFNLITRFRKLQFLGGRASSSSLNFRSQLMQKDSIHLSSDPKGCTIHIIHFLLFHYINAIKWRGFNGTHGHLVTFNYLG